MLKILALTAALVVSTVPLIAQDSQNRQRCDPARRRRRSDCQNPRQDQAHHRYRASPNGKRARFCLSEIPNTGT